MQNLALYENSIPLEKNFPIKFHFSGAQGKRSLHWHEHLELLYFTDGPTNVICGGETFTGQKNDLVIIDCNQLHSTDEGSFFCLRINPSFFADVSFESIILKPHISNDKTIRDCFEKIAEEYQKMSEGYDMEIKSLSYHLITHILRNYRLKDLSEYEILLQKNKVNKIRDVLEYISNNYHLKVTTKSLAEHFYLSEQYFCHLFKSQTKQSPMDYINKYRAEKASFLLKNTQHSITEIALAVGFDNPTYFSRVFRKYMKTTPSDYRKD